MTPQAMFRVRRTPRGATSLACAGALALASAFAIPSQAFAAETHGDIWTMTAYYGGIIAGCHNVLANDIDAGTLAGVDIYAGYVTSFDASGNLCVLSGGGDAYGAYMTSLGLVNFFIAYRP